MLTKEAMRELLAKVAEERGWPNEARNLREDNVFSGQVVIGNVYEAMQRAYQLGRGEKDGNLPADAWRYVPVTMPFLAELFDAYCGADGHNLVVKTAASSLGQKLG